MLSRYISVAILARAADAGAEPAVLICAAATGMSATHGALILGALTVSAVAGGPVLGSVIDRSRRIGSAYAAGLVAIGSGIALLAVGLGRFPLPALLPIAMLAGAAQPLFSGGWTSILTALVPSCRIRRAYAIDAVTYDLGGILGPGLAGAAVAVGDRAPLLCMALLALAATPILLLGRWPRAQRPPGSLRRDIRAGLFCLAHVRPLRTVTVLSTLQYAGMAGRTVAAPVLAVHLTGHAAFAGILFAASAAASLIGSALLTRYAPARPPHRIALAATAISAASLAGLAVAGTAWIAVALFAVGGLVDAPLLTSVFAIRGEHSPEHLRAQVFATAASIKTSVYAVAIMLFGLAIEAGLGTCLLLGAAVQVLGILTGSGQPRESPVRGSAPT